MSYERRIFSADRTFLVHQLQLEISQSGLLAETVGSKNFRAESEPGYK